MIIVVGNRCYAEPIRHLDKVTFEPKSLTEDPKESSLVMFTGGEDIHPHFYKGIDHYNVCSTNIQRDKYEEKIFRFCVKHGIKMTGICRGIQFLNVMAGGFMYQHITRHAGVVHKAYFPYDDTVKKVTSTHHQLVGLPNSAVPIAWSSPKRSEIYVGPFGLKIEPPEHEIEAAVFPNINAMGVQYHPEMLGEEDSCRIHYGRMVGDFVEMDVEEFIDKYDEGAANGQSKRVGESGQN